jgi:transposase
MMRASRPYRKFEEDGNDAEAICEAVGRPTMRFVPVKSAEQQAILSLHRVRQGFIEQRTATINRIRVCWPSLGWCCRSARNRYGGRRSWWPTNCPFSRARLLLICARTFRTSTNGSPARSGSWSNWRDSGRRRYGCSACPAWAADRLAITATSATARIRQWSAVCGGWDWCGNTRPVAVALGTPNGATSFTLLMLECAVLQSAAQKSDRVSRWAMALRARRGYHRAIIAVAAKNARIIWALLANHREFALPQ